MSNYFRVSDDRSEGAMIGDSTDSPVGFYNTAPVGQQVAASTLTGASDTTAVANAINALNTALKNIGITA